MSRVAQSARVIALLRSVLAVAWARAPLLLVACISATSVRSAGAEQNVACGHFSEAATAAPAPRDDQHSLERLAAINAAVKTEQYSTLFFGDSITERWTPEIWQRNFAPRKILNAGIDGDRTEHLLWRLDHGNLDGPLPTLIVLLIGTNDLGHGRSPSTAAEGIRSDLVHLHDRLPNTHILLLGLTPRSDRFHDEVIEVDRLISTCGRETVTYADIGKILGKNKDRPSKGILLDGVHFSAHGYDLLTRHLIPLIDGLLWAR